MLIKELISKAEKDYMIATLLKHYKVDKIKVKYKHMKEYAWYNVDTGTLELSSKYKEVKPKQLKDFLTTIIHEIYHAMDAKKYGWRQFKGMYEKEQNMIAQGWYDNKKDIYWDNEYEVNARDFAKKNLSKWKSQFSKK